MSDNEPKRAHVRTGRKPPGRKPGVPNKITAEAREVFRQVLENLAPEAEGWIRATADKDPARAAELLLRLSERFIPALSRTEVSGPEEAPIYFSIDLSAAEGE